MPRRPSKKRLASQLEVTPKQVRRELRAFSRSARLLSSHHPRLINEHPNEWVAVYDGKVQATAKSFNALIAKLNKQSVPPNESIIRYMDTSGQKLIL